MAGRGCTICIQILNSDLKVESINLPVALHSPLTVLKQQLAPFCGIPESQQVLILCDLSDPDRNNDKLLCENVSLAEHGIKNNSVLTLHALGLSVEKKQELTIQALQKLSEKPVFEENLFTLHSKVSASEANHSYNGIIFDIESHSSYEIEVRSVSIAGMLGRVRVFARDQPWEAEKLENTNASHYWARRESLNPKGWYKIADQFCRPSWDNPIEVVDLFIY